MILENFKRYTVMLFGLFVTAFGLASCVKADMGISPITTLSNALNHIVPVISLGTFLFFQSLVFFILTVLLLRREFKLYQLLLLPCSFLLGWFVDLAKLMLAGLPLPNYMAQAAVLLVGCIFVGLGFSLMICSGVSLDTNTAFLNALCYRTGKPYSRLKIGTDLMIVALAALVSLAFAHRVIGIREGTIAAAVLIGTIAGFFNRHLYWLEKFFTSEKGRQNFGYTKNGKGK